MQKHTFFLGLAFSIALSGCSWNTYTKADGSTGLRPASSANHAVYYEDGSYSSNMNYNQYRPVRHAVPLQNIETENERVNWP